MQGAGSTPSEDTGAYFDMEPVHSESLTTSTPMKSTSTSTLVHSDSVDQTVSNKDQYLYSSPSSKTPPISIRDGACALSMLTPVRARAPSGDGGYVVMSPGVNHITGESEHTSLATLEESLGKQCNGSIVYNRINNKGRVQKKKKYLWKIPY